MKCGYPNCKDPAVMSINAGKTVTETACVKHANAWLTTSAIIVLGFQGEITFTATAGRWTRRRRSR